MMRRKLLAVAVLAICGALLLVTIAGAGGRAATKVTIRAQGLDLSGYVESPRPNKCADGRKVNVIRQRGERGGPNDEKIASDTAELQGNRARWSTGNTGQEGRFYAKVGRNQDCQGDSSRTIRAQN